MVQVIHMLKIFRNGLNVSPILNFANASILKHAMFQNPNVQYVSNCSNV